MALDCDAMTAARAAASGEAEWLRAVIAHRDNFRPTQWPVIPVVIGAIGFVSRFSRRDAVRDACQPMPADPRYC